MTFTRPMSKAERASIVSRAKRDAARHMLSDGLGFRETQRITGLGNGAMFAIRGDAPPVERITVRRLPKRGGF